MRMIGANNDEAVYQEMPFVNDSASLFFLEMRFTFFGNGLSGRF